MGAKRQGSRGRLEGALDALRPIVVLREHHLLPGAGIQAPPVPDGARLAIDVAPGITLSGVLATRPDAVAAIVYFGGNGEVIGARAGIVRLARSHPFNAYAVNYRGFGASGGTASLDTVSGDAAAVFDAVAARPEVRGKPILVYGFSLGSCPALTVAGQRKVAGIVLQSPPSSAAEVAPKLTSLLPWYLRWMARIALAREVAARDDQPVLLARRASAPLLVMHGDADRTVPIELGREVFEAAASVDKHWVSVPGAGHIDLWEVGGEALHRRFDEFLGRVTGQRTGR